jgi:hypothetical protein
MKGEAQKDIDRMFRENRQVVDEPLKPGVRRAMLRYKTEGSSVVIERDGKIEWLKPEDLGFLTYYANMKSAVRGNSWTPGVGLRVQLGARRHGIGGIYGNGGNVESASYRI